MKQLLDYWIGACAFGTRSLEPLVFILMGTQSTAAQAKRFNAAGRERAQSTQFYYGLFRFIGKSHTPAEIFQWQVYGIFQQNVAQRERKQILLSH